jgi:hypothetical protein
MAEAISELAAGSQAMMAEVLAKSSESDPLLMGVPGRVRDIWARLLEGGSEPFCFRPDLLVETSGQARAIEFNVDTRLDRGISQGITEYARPLVASPWEEVPYAKLTDAYVAEAH